MTTDIIKEALKRYERTLWGHPKPEPDGRNHDTYVQHSLHACAALDAYEALRKRVEWQPIETAPRDGTKILCLERCGDMQVDWWNLNGCTDRFWKEHGDQRFRYTHWMPLPEPPAALNKEGE